MVYKLYGLKNDLTLLTQNRDLEKSNKISFFQALL